MANRFWVGGTGTWDNSTTTHWSASSGGAGGQSVPGSSDSVIFDNLSGGGIVTPDYNFSILSMNLINGYSGTLACDTNNVSPTSQQIFSDAGGGWTLNMGSGTWTFTGTGTCFNISVETGYTVNSNTSTIKIINTSDTAITFNVAGTNNIFNNIWFSRGTSIGDIIIANSNTFANFKDDGTVAHSIKFTDGTTQIITSLTIIGTSGNLITLTGTSTGGWTISDTSGINTVEYCTISYSTAQGGATWNAFTADGNVDGGNNTGWNFTTPTQGNFFSIL